MPSRSNGENPIMWHPAPHARIVASGDDLVILDLAADRYLGLPGAIVSNGVEASFGGRRVGIHRDAASALDAAGLIVSADGLTTPVITLPEQAIDHSRSGTSAPSWADFIDLLVALVLTGWRLWRAQPCRLHETARTASIQPADHARLRQQLAHLDRLRLILPTPRRCLPSALLTCLWLHRKGISSEIVFGVRTHPFEAHCWAEHDGVVLNDDIDRLRGYIPISIGRP